MDSQLIVKLLRRKLAPSHPLVSLVARCQGFLSKDRCVRFRHIYREANSAADYLASFAFSFPIGTMYCLIPRGVLNFLSYDVGGLAIPI